MDKNKCVVCQEPMSREDVKEQEKWAPEFQIAPAHSDCFESFENADEFVKFAKEAQAEVTGHMVEAATPQYVICDWKESPGDLMDELKPILDEMGIKVYELPSMEGSDQYGWVISQKAMTKKDIKKFEIENNLRDEED